MWNDWIHRHTTRILLADSRWSSDFHVHNEACFICATASSAYISSSLTFNTERERNWTSEDDRDHRSSWTTHSISFSRFLRGNLSHTCPLLLLLLLLLLQLDHWNPLRGTSIKSLIHFRRHSHSHLKRLRRDQSTFVFIHSLKQVISE